MYSALATIADERLEIHRRRRRGDGKWYAVVEVIRWLNGVGKGLAAFHEECNGATAAVEAAKRLLTEHMKHIAADTTADARTMTDIEWMLEQEDDASDSELD